MTTREVENDENFFFSFFFPSLCSSLKTMASAPLPLQPSEQQQQLHDQPPQQQQQQPEQPPIVPPPPRHPLKRIRVGTGPDDGREVSICLQNENGPCPLLAAANALIIRGDLSLGTSTTSISQVRV